MNRRRPPSLSKQLNVEHEAEAELQAQEQQEAEKILDEPPPEVPPAPDPQKDVAALRLINEFGSLMKSLNAVTANRRPEYFRRARVDPKVAAKLGQFIVDLAPILAGNGVDRQASAKATGEKHVAAETVA